MAGIPIRILFVEDSPDDAEVVLEHLRREGFEPEPRIVDTAEAFRVALQGAAWDVILSDFSMPHFDGLKAFDLLLAQKLDIPFIFVSGHIGEDRAVEAMRHGVSDYVLKDHLARLVPAIQREMRARENRRHAAAEGPARPNGPSTRVGSRSSTTGTGGTPRHAARPDDVPPQALSPRQREVLLLVAEGRTSKEIAAALGLAAKTAGAHRASLMQKLRIHTVVGLVRYAIRHGLIKP